MNSINYVLKKLSSYKTPSLRCPSPLTASASLHPASGLHKQEQSTKDDGYARVRGDRRPHFPPLCFTAGKNKKSSRLKPSYKRVFITTIPKKRRHCCTLNNEGHTDGNNVKEGEPRNQRRRIRREEEVRMKSSEEVKKKQRHQQKEASK